jgi:RimJ/RimL family protein N-acetyltransferase
MERLKNFNIGELTILPLSIRHTSHYMKACRESKNYLGDFLDWGENVQNLPFKNHLNFIQGCIKTSKYYPSFSVFYGERFVGFFSYSPACDLYGVQICYWISRPFSGKGIATEVTDLLVERAFLGYRFNYVELHIDEENIASKRIPEKLNFSVFDHYSDKMGTKGSGKMQLWVKDNPYPRFRQTVKVKLNRNLSFGWSQSRRFQIEREGKSSALEGVF